MTKVMIVALKIMTSILAVEIKEKRCYYFNMRGNTDVSLPTVVQNVLKTFGPIPITPPPFLTETKTDRLIRTTLGLR